MIGFTRGQALHPNAAVLTIAAAVLQADAAKPTVDSSALGPVVTKAIVEGVGERLKDPYTAHYRLPPIGGPWGQTVYAYCGCVNSKNSYGGYTGFDVFAGILVIADGKAAFWAKFIQDGDLPPGIAKFCKEKNYDPAC